MDNKILHESNGTVTGSCSNGSISISGQSNSELVVTITPEIAGKTIECFVRFDGNYIRHLSQVIPNITGLSVIRIILYSQPMICMQYGKFGNLRRKNIFVVEGSYEN